MAVSLSFGFLIPRPPYGSKPIAFRNGKLVSWGNEVEELFAEIDPSEVYKLQPRARK